MSWTNWGKKQPANKTADQDCAVLSAKDGKFEAIRCSDSALAICRLGGPVRFQLRGGCPGIDSQYTMVNSSHMIGNISAKDWGKLWIALSARYERHLLNLT